MRRSKRRAEEATDQVDIESRLAPYVPVDPAEYPTGPSSPPVDEREASVVDDLADDPPEDAWSPAALFEASPRASADHDPVPTNDTTDTTELVDATELPHEEIAPSPDPTPVAATESKEPTGGLAPSVARTDQRPSPPQRAPKPAPRSSKPAPRSSLPSVDQHAGPDWERWHTAP